MFKFHDRWDKDDILFYFSILQIGACISMQSFYIFALHLRNINTIDCLQICVVNCVVNNIQDNPGFSFNPYPWYNGNAAAAMVIASRQTLPPGRTGEVFQAFY